MLYNKDWNYTLNPIADLLMKAADVLERDGHTKGTLKDDQGRRCFLGACYTALGWDDYTALGWDGNTPPLSIQEQALDAALALAQALYLNVTSDGPYGAVVRWNDNMARLEQEVIDAMRMTAHKLNTVEEEVE